MSWLPLPPLYEKFGSETITETFVKKALATSQLIFKPKKPILSSQAGFCRRMKTQTLQAPHSKTFHGGEGIKMIHQPSFSPNTATLDSFLFQRGEVEAVRPLAVTGWSHDKLGRNQPNQHQK
jgi:hypothetical protein